MSSLAYFYCTIFIHWPCPKKRFTKIIPISVVHTREGGYVSTKLQFNGGDINNLDILIHYLRDGGGELLTDKVYLKVGKIGEQL